MTTIRVISYKESRLDYFRRMKEQHVKALHWWKYQKPHKQYYPQTIQETCAEHGAAISYLDDVIEMLEKVGVEND
jgi:hypothetical protein